MGCAHTSRLVTFDEHPDTHIKLMDYQLPFVTEAVELCKKYATKEDAAFVNGILSTKD